MSIIVTPLEKRHIQELNSEKASEVFSGKHFVNITTRMHPMINTTGHDGDCKTFEVMISR